MSEQWRHPKSQQQRDWQREDGRASTPFCHEGWRGTRLRDISNIHGAQADEHVRFLKEMEKKTPHQVSEPAPNASRKQQNKGCLLAGGITVLLITGGILASRLLFSAYPARTANDQTQRPGNK